MDEQAIFEPSTTQSVRLQLTKVANNREYCYER